MKKLIAILALCASAHSPLWAGPAAEYTRMLIQQQQHDYSTRETIIIRDPDRREASRTVEIERYFDRQPSPNIVLELLLED